MAELDLRRAVTKNISAEDVFSDPIVIKGRFNLSLSGTWVAIVHLQRSFNNGNTWLDVDAITFNTEEGGEEPEYNMQYRFGVKAGNYTSGTVAGRLSQ